MRLYHMQDSGNCYKVRLAARQLGYQLDLVDVDILKGESRTGDFLAKNPNGRVPLLELDDGRFLPESNAMLWYLADGTNLLPEDRFERAQVLQWMFFEQYSHEPAIAVARFWIALKPGGAEEKKAEIPHWHEKGYAALGVMDEHLSQRAFFVADRYSIADIALYAYTHIAQEGGFDLGSYSAVAAWLDRVASQVGHCTIDAR